MITRMLTLAFRVLPTVILFVLAGMLGLGAVKARPYAEKGLRWLVVESTGGLDEPCNRDGSCLPGLRCYEQFGIGKHVCNLSREGAVLNQRHETPDMGVAPDAGSASTSLLYSSGSTWVPTVTPLTVPVSRGGIGQLAIRPSTGRVFTSGATEIISSINSITVAPSGTSANTFGVAVEVEKVYRKGKDGVRRYTNHEGKLCDDAGYCNWEWR